MYQLISETFYFTLFKTNKTLNESYSTWYHIRENTLLNGHLILKNFRSTEHVDQRSVRLFYCRLDQGYQNLDEILASREEIQIFSRNMNNPVNTIFFSRGSEILYKFFQRKKIYRISRTATSSIRKKFEIIRGNEKKKKNDRGEEKKCSLRLTYCTTRLAW